MYTDPAIQQEGSRKKRRKKGCALILAILIFIVVFSFWIGSFNGQVQDAWNVAATEFNAGARVDQSLRASWMSLECGVRTILSDPIFRLASFLESQQQDDQALDACMTGARIMGRYNPLIDLSFKCELAVEMHQAFSFPGEKPDSVSTGDGLITVQIETPRPFVQEKLPTSTPFQIVEVVDARGVKMNFVPAGKYFMGSANGDWDEAPVTEIFLGDFYIDTYEVTTAQYAACVDAGVCELPADLGSPTRISYYADPQFGDYPVTNVNWYMANDYCAWREARLPTEAEWEKAARGADMRTYPWGEGLSCALANYDGRDCVGDLTAVGAYETGRSIYGVYDMTGNVLEWVSSLVKPYPYRADDGREDLQAQGPRIMRGGSWESFADRLRIANRFSNNPSYALDTVGSPGIRCAKSTLE